MLSKSLKTDCRISTLSMLSNENGSRAHLDDILNYLKTLEYKQIEEILEKLIDNSDLSQIDFLWTILQPFSHRDFYYNGKIEYPGFNFVKLSTPITRIWSQKRRHSSGYIFRKQDALKINQDYKANDQKLSSEKSVHLPNIEPERKSISGQQTKVTFQSELIQFPKLKIKIESNLSLQARFHTSILPQETEDKIRVFLKTYNNDLNDNQKNSFLRNLVVSLDPRFQYFLLSLLHIKKYRDFISLLPEDLSLKILSHLTSFELLKASLVNRKWRKLCSSEILWRPKCHQMIKDLSHYTKDDQITNWKELYKKIKILRKNWLLGKCKLTEFKGHRQDLFSKIVIEEFLELRLKMNLNLLSSILILICLKNALANPLASGRLNEPILKSTVQPPKFTGVYLTTKNMSNTSARISHSEHNAQSQNIESSLMSSEDQTATSTTHKLSQNDKKIFSTTKIIQHDSLNIHQTNSHMEAQMNQAHHNVSQHVSPSGHQSGGHGTPPPSYQLHPHTHIYKPEGFHLFAQDLGLKKILIGFDYPTPSHYDRYIIRIRYHGHEEYSTDKIKVHKNDTNKLILNKFLDAQYVICVTLFSSSGLPEYPPISTSDMCIDVTAGEAPHIGGHHSTTGLLSPLLVAVAAVLLIFIVIGQNIKDLYNERHKLYESKRKQSTHSKEIQKSETQIKFEQMIRAPEDPKWMAAGQICQIVDNRSFDDLTDPNNLYHNSPAKRYSIKDLDDDQNEHRNYRTSRLNSQNITSIQTLSHLLDSKPWSNRVASGSKDKTIKIWNLIDGRLKQTLKGHLKGVWCLVFLTRYLLCSGSYDSTIKIWNLKESVCSRTLISHDGAVWSLIKSDNFLLSASQDKTVKIWDLCNCKLVNTLYLKGSVYSIDTNSTLIATVSSDKYIKLWNKKSGDCVKSFQSEKNNCVQTVSLIDDILACSCNQIIKVWKIALNYDLELIQEYKEHYSRIETIKLIKTKWLNNELLFVSGDKDGIIKYWNLKKLERTVTVIIKKCSYISCSQLLSSECDLF
ncbi:unnamed protein product [Brachionus calyciflorus]|uniref:F-box domain-containing protein n=1 Tax=Brachionus calyciflorus TaxID=104777 RepID=A0A813M3G4_9BILA|nr:unnamed protein product [Brachionus calyciflorus]